MVAPLFVRIASTVSVFLVPAEPCLLNSCLLRACVGTARFRLECSSRRRRVLFSYVRFFPYRRILVRARVLSRARFSVRAPFSCGRLVRARVLSGARFSAWARASPRAYLLRARVFSARALLRARVLSARVLLRARVLSRARSSACARAFPLVPSVCVHLFYHTACGAVFCILI